MTAKKKVTQYAFDSDAFKEKLKKARDDMHLRNSELAERTGVSAATIGHYIKGERTPRGFGDICPIAKALNVSLDYLAGLCEYNYLADAEKNTSSRPQNYHDVVKLISLLMESFKGKSDLSIDLGTCACLKITDPRLTVFLSQQERLFDLAGGALSMRLYSLAMEELDEKMKNESLESPIKSRLSGLEGINPEDIPF